MQRIVEHALDRRTEVLRDVDVHKRLSHHLLLGVARDLDRLVVPFVHQPVVVDAEDRRVGRVDEGLQLLRHGRLLDLNFLAVRDVLADAQHADDLALDVAARRRVQQHLDTTPVLSEDRELEVCSALPVQRVVEHALHRCAEVLRDVHINK